MAMVPVVIPAQIRTRSMPTPDSAGKLFIQGVVLTIRLVVPMVVLLLDRLGENMALKLVQVVTNMARNAKSTLCVRSTSRNCQQN